MFSMRSNSYKLPDCYYYGSTTSDDYQWSSTSRGNGKLDLHKVLKQSPNPWKIKKPHAVLQKKKKIIVSDVLFFKPDDKDDIEYRRKTLDFLEFLLNKNFQVYFINKFNKEFIPFNLGFLELLKESLKISSEYGDLSKKTKQISSSSICDHFLPSCMDGSTKEIEQLLFEMNINKDHYYIYDQQAASSLQMASIKFHDDLETPEEVEKLSKTCDVTQLTSLEITANHSQILEKISSFKQLKNIENIERTECKISDLSLLPNTLKKITIKNARSSDLDLTTYRNLEEFSILKSDQKNILLPESIHKLTIDACNNLSISETLSRLPNLQALKLKCLDIDNFEIINESLRKTTLKELNISYLKIREIAELPDTLESLFVDLVFFLNKMPRLPLSLKKLGLSFIDLLELPKVEDTKLETYSLYKLSNISIIPPLPSTLKHLAINNLVNLTKLPELSHTQLETLHLEELSIEELPELPHTIKSLNLNYLNIKHVPKLDHTQITTLEIDSCYNLESIGELPSTLKMLIIHLKSHLEKFPELQHTNLETLIIKTSNDNDDFSHIIQSLPSTMKKMIINDKPLEVSDKLKTPLFMQIKKEQNEAYKLVTRYTSQLKRIEKIRNKQISNKVLSLINSSNHHHTASLTSSSIDRFTNNNPNKQFNPSFEIYSDINTNPLHWSTYRWLVHDVINLAQDTITFSQSNAEFKKTNEIKIQFVNKFLPEQLILENNQYFVRFPIQKELINQWVPLPGLNHGDKILTMMLDKSKGEEIKYVPEYGQYIIKLKRMRDKPLYFIAEKNGNSKETSKDKSLYPKLPSKIIQALDNAFNASNDKQYPKFNQLKSKINGLKKLPPKDRAKEFTKSNFLNYFKEFNFNKDLKTSGKSVDLILQLLKERQGVCRHRASAYMILGQYLEIPVRKIINEVHEKVEVYHNNKWQTIDLGGGPANISTPPQLNLDEITLKDKQNEYKSTTPENKEKNEKSEVKQIDEKIQQNTTITQPHIKKDWSKYFSPQFDSKSFKDSNQVLDFILQEKNISIPASNFDEARSLYAALTKRYQERKEETEKKEVFYLESVEDIFENFELTKSEDKGKFSIISGPLKNIISQGGILVINWGRFKSEEIRSYKSILDKDPTFLQISVQCQVISLIPNETIQCETLFSRSKKFSWPNHISFPENPCPLQIEEQIEEKHFATIDLFDDADSYQNILLGAISLKDGFTPGALIHAINTGKTTLHIYDAPLHNANFQAFMTRLLTQRIFYSNGEKIELPSDFTIRFLQASYKTRPEKLQPLPSNKFDFKKEEYDVFYLNTDTLLELQTRNIIENEEYQSIPGWLNTSSESRKKIIIQTEALSTSEERRFFSIIENVEELNSIYYLDITKENLAAYDMPDLKITPQQNLIITTNDPDFIKNKLAKDFEKVSIFQITNNTYPGDILGNIIQNDEKEKTDNFLRFKFVRQKVAELLLENKTVILYGTLSKELYRALEPLFGFSPSLNLADTPNPVEIKGQLLIVTTPLSFMTALPQYTNSLRNVSRENLKNLYQNFFDEQDKELLEKILQFYKIAEAIPHGTVGMPSAPALTEQRIRNMLIALKENKNDNPIKAFFLHDYDKNSEVYAKLNVFAKYLFGNLETKPAYRSKKLEKYNAFTSVWIKANCFNAAALRKLELNELSNEKLSALTDECKHLVNQTDPQTKYNKIMKQYLEVYHGVVLKGPPGSGKTFLSMQYANDSKHHHLPFFGENNILKFLKSIPTKDQKAVLIIDEANLKTPGYWDFLAPIFSPERPCTIQFQNQTFQLDSKRYEVIFTCNPESYPGRDYHALLQAIPTLRIDKWTNENIKALVIKPAIESYKTILTEEVIDNILRAYNKMQELAPDTLSLRDLMQVLRRYIYHVQVYNDLDNAVYHACMTEWLSTLPHEKAKLQFENFITSTQQSLISDGAREKFSPILQKLKKEKDFYLCDKIIDMLTKVNEDIELARTNKINGSDENLQVKLGILVEGKSGIGKSTAFVKLLQAKGFKRCTRNDLLDENLTDLSQSYFQFTADSNNKDNDVKILQAAFDKGCKVILDELDVGTELEEVLNQLLTGKSIEGNPPKVAGFYLLASQNGHYLSGLSSVSNALLNRLHIYYPDELKYKDLFQLAHDALNDLVTKSELDKLVRAYLSQQTAHPDEVNMRTFLEGLTKIKNSAYPSVLPSLELKEEKEDPMTQPQFTEVKDKNGQALLKILNETIADRRKENKDTSKNEFYQHAEAASKALAKLSDKELNLEKNKVAIQLSINIVTDPTEDTARALEQHVKREMVSYKKTILGIALLTLAAVAFAVATIFTLGVTPIVAAAIGIGIKTSIASTVGFGVGSSAVVGTAGIGIFSYKNPKPDKALKSFAQKTMSKSHF